MLKIRCEGLKHDPLHFSRAISSRLSIPALDSLVDDTQYESGRVYDGTLQVDTRAVAWGLGYKLLQTDEISDF